MRSKFACEGDPLPWAPNTLRYQPSAKRTPPDVIRTDVLANEPVLSGGEVELARDPDAVLERARDRAPVSVNFQCPFYLLAVLLLSNEMESLLYPPDHEDFALSLYLSHRIGVEVIERNLTRYQRAPKGPQQSPTCCGY